MARGTKRRKRTGVQPPRGPQPLLLDPVRQKLRVAHGLRRGVQQKLTPEIPPHTPAPPVREGQPPALDPEFLPHGLAPPVHGFEFSPHAPARPVRTLEILPREVERERLEDERGRHSPEDEPRLLADQASWARDFREGFRIR